MILNRIRNLNPNLNFAMKTKFQRNFVTQTSNHRSGFTLVELLLVLVILGILAAIVIPKFAGRSEQAKEQAAVTQISSFSTACNNFEVDNSYYPKSLADLLAQPRDAQNWHGPYLQSDVVPKDPWGNDYIYKVPGGHNPSFFDLSSGGPPGGDKVIANWTIKR
jgi:general secretion pathway protein G